MLRKAQISDVKEIQKLLVAYANSGDMLSRSLSELYETIRDFYVYEKDERIIGAAALHIVWEDLAEVRSVAVLEGMTRAGIGSKLVGACIDEACQLRLKRIFCLTYRPDFFSTLGFKMADKSELPQKVWGDCIRCVKFPDCDENAMVLDFKS